MTIYISLAAVLVSALSLLLAGRKESRQDAASSARVEAQLGSIRAGVDDIRVEMRTMRKVIAEHGERLARVEAMAAGNARRIAALEGTLPDE